MVVTYAGVERYTDILGHRICYLDEGQGSPLLFVHGLGGSMSNWAPNMERFKQSHRVVALDLPGHGKSDFFDETYDMSLFTAVVRQLLAQLGIERITVVGNSLGGMISLCLSLEHPALVENLVLVDTAGCHHFPRLLRWALRRVPDHLIKRGILFYFSRLLRMRPFFRTIGAYERNQYTEALIEETIDSAERADIDDYLEAYLRCARTAVNTCLIDRLAELAKPVLIIWGQKDIGLGLRIGQQANTMIKGSFLVAIPRAAHVPQLDQPEAFNEAVALFLAGAGATR